MVLDTFVYMDVLSVAGHELRTPLAVLKLQTQHLHKRANPEIGATERGLAQHL